MWCGEVAPNEAMVSACTAIANASVRQTATQSGGGALNGIGGGGTGGEGEAAPPLAPSAAATDTDFRGRGGGGGWAICEKRRLKPSERLAAVHITRFGAELILTLKIRGHLLFQDCT